MNEILRIVTFARSQFPEMRFAEFYNLWRIAKELSSLGAVQTANAKLAQQGQSAIANIITAISALETTFHCTTSAPQTRQILFPSQIWLVESGVELYKQGFVIVCDDLNTFEQIRMHTACKQKSTELDWIQKLYVYLTDRNLVNIMEMLRHPLLSKIERNFNETVLQWEHSIRKNREQNIDEGRPSNPLVSKLLNTSRDEKFNSIFKQVIQHFPASIQQRLLALADYTTILDGSNFCLEWFRGAAKLSMSPPQLCSSLAEALKFKPNQVVFCLKRPNLQPLFSQSLLKASPDEKFQELFFKWKNQLNLYVIAHSPLKAFDNPLVQTEMLEHNPLKRLTMKQDRPIANPEVNTRPTTISATGFNQLMQDPYGFYARYILKLKAIERTGSQSYAREFGLAAHKMVELSLKQDMDVSSRLLESLKLSGPEILWKGRLQRILNWVRTQVRDLEPLTMQIEETFQTELTAVGPITLKARIDACFSMAKGDLVVNFKTGAPPSKSEVIEGYAPQLAIEMFLAGLSNNHKPIQAEFWQLKGTQPAGIISSSLAIPNKILLEHIEKIVFHYFMKKNPFSTCPWPSKTPIYSEYKYLERLG